MSSLSQSPHSACSHAGFLLKRWSLSPAPDNPDDIRVISSGFTKLLQGRRRRDTAAFTKCVVNWSSCVKSMDCPFKLAPVQVVFHFCLTGPLQTFQVQSPDENVSCKYCNLLSSFNLTLYQYIVIPSYNYIVIVILHVYHGILYTVCVHVYYICCTYV